MRFMQSLFYTVAFISLMSITACSPAMIPGTNVEDTQQNRSVVAFLVQYRQAVLKRSSSDVLQLVSSQYFENNGTANAEDDYNYQGLQKKLSEQFNKMKDIQLDLFLQNVTPNKETGTLTATYRYNARMLVSLPVGEQWIHMHDVEQMTIRPKNQSYEILSGL